MGRYKIYYNINGGNLKYNLTYGELTRDGLLNLFKDVDTNNKTFYDLGSGDGNVLIYASEEFPNLKSHYARVSKYGGIQKYFENPVNPYFVAE